MDQSEGRVWSGAHHACARQHMLGRNGGQAAPRGVYGCSMQEGACTSDEPLDHIDHTHRQVDNPLDEGEGPDRVEQQRPT